jgi:ADP-ribosyl-[dinitrogen reductase] hydrolase
MGNDMTTTNLPVVLVGTVIGDALGMPFEGLSADNKALLEWDGVSFLPSRPRPPTYYGSTLALNAGQYTDDTQMSIIVAQSLLDNKGYNPDEISQRYVEWIYSGVARGYGRTTQLAIQALKEGKSYTESGVQGSYGNGSAMRAAPFGVFFCKDKDALIEVVKIDSAITHKSDEAEAGALTIALATYLIVNHEQGDMCRRIAEYLPSSKVKDLMLSMDTIVSSDCSPSVILKVIGTKARVQETVPAAMFLYSYYVHYQDAVVAAIRCGGDCDTTASCVGALFGAEYGLAGIPKMWHTVEDFDKLVELDQKLYDGAVGQ